MATASSPEVPGPEGPKLVSFSGVDVPVQAVTVFCNNKAEITRVMNFSSLSSLGRHEVRVQTALITPQSTAATHSLRRLVSYLIVRV